MFPYCRRAIVSFDQVWLSISCAMNNEDRKLMHGYQESVTNSKAKFYDYLENSLTKFSEN